jgi:hypothetical protein
MRQTDKRTPDTRRDTSRVTVGAVDRVVDTAGITDQRPTNVSFPAGTGDCDGFTIVLPREVTPAATVQRRRARPVTPGRLCAHAMFPDPRDSNEQAWSIIIVRL